MMRLVLSLLLFFVNPWDAAPMLHQGRICPASSLLSPTDQVSQLDPLPEKEDPSLQKYAQMQPVGSLQERLYSYTEGVRLLPTRYPDIGWVNLSVLHLRTWDPLQEILQPVSNFTLYSSEQFTAIRDLYFAWKKDPTLEKQNRLAAQLQSAYRELSGTTYLQTVGKAKRYPTGLQLQLEALWERYQPIFWLGMAYGTAFFLLLFASQGMAALLGGFVFLFHSALLALRVAILGRPPVANMGETLLYVPWVALLLGGSIAWWGREKRLLFAALGVGCLCLSAFFLFDISIGFENVAPVLDSQFWLSIHVLCVVASYGAFALASVLAHVILLRRQSPVLLSALPFALYVGLFLLLVGTILGGVWAAQSWGRFWDWDPKESWAFLSCCTYVILLHLYRYQKISNTGLAIGAVVGFLVISFTWYGVNYLLGTGLHSYGFGAGGETAYLIFFLAELFFLGNRMWRSPKFNF